MRPQHQGVEPQPESDELVVCPKCLGLQFAADCGVCDRCEQLIISHISGDLECNVEAYEVCTHCANFYCRRCTRTFEFCLGCAGIHCADCRAQCAKLGGGGTGVDWIFALVKIKITHTYNEPEEKWRDPRPAGSHQVRWMPTRR